MESSGKELTPHHTEGKYHLDRVSQSLGRAGWVAMKLCSKVANRLVYWGQREFQGYRAFNFKPGQNFKSSLKWVFPCRVLVR